MDTERFTLPGDLALIEALKVVPHLRGEAARIAIQRMLLRHVRGHLPSPATPAEDARVIANQLRAQDQGDFYSSVLRTIRELSRRDTPPTAFQIVRALRARA